MLKPHKKRKASLPIINGNEMLFQLNQLNKMKSIPPDYYQERDATSN